MKVEKDADVVDNARVVCLRRLPEHSRRNVTQEQTDKVKKRVLVVDDERAVLDALRRMLQSQHDQWEITYLDHAADAWAKLLEETSDLLT